jgi:nitroreductase/NAD-dependent dihydropyrimidine dehydrogenase PreA subunit
MTYTIEKTECIFCGICTDECPSKTITIDKEAGTAEINPAGCIECSHCGMVCPVNAVRAGGERLPEYPEDKDTTAHLIKSKRSVRSYRPDSLPQDKLKAIIEAGELSATATNSRHLEALLLQGEEVAAGAAFIAGILLRFVKIARSPVVRGILSVTGLSKYARKESIGYFYRGLLDTIDGKRDLLFFKAPAVVVITYPASAKRFGRTDSALAGQNMMLLAHSMGIGSCMIGFAETALWNRRLRRRFGVSSDRLIGLIFTLGYTDRKYLRYPVRKSWNLPC